MNNKQRTPLGARHWAALPDLYHQMDLFEGPNGYRLRSALARAISAGANPTVANAKYRAARVTVIKAVRRG
jgi:hypothetical protein